MSDYINEIVSEISKITFDMFLDNEEQKIDKYFDLMNPSANISRSISNIKIYDVSTIRRTIDNNPSKIYRLFTPSTKREFVINIPKSTFMNSITETYKSDTDILNQFICDFYRQRVYYDNKKCSSIDGLFYYLSKYNHMTDVLNTNASNMSSMMLMLLMTCQSSHFLSYFYPHSAINTSSKSKSTNSIYVMNGDNMSNININTSPNDYSCQIDSNYKILNIESNTKTHEIDAKTMISNSSDVCYIKYCIKKV